MIRRRNLIWLIPLTIITTFPLWRPLAAAFLSPASTQPSTPAAEQGPRHDFILEQIRVIASTNGQRPSEITARRAATIMPGQLELTEVQAKIPSGPATQTAPADQGGQEDKGQLLHVRADRGLYHQESALLTLMDQARVVNPAEGYELQSDLLHYNESKQTLISPGPIIFQAQGILVTGSSLSYDLASGHYEVLGQVRCTLSQLTLPGTE